MNAIWNGETLTNGATNVLLALILLGCLVGAVWARRSLRANRPAPYWLLRWNHRLQHVFREEHNCLDSLTDHRPEWY